MGLRRFFAWEARPGPLDRSRPHRIVILNAAKDQQCVSSPASISAEYPRPILAIFCCRKNGKPRSSIAWMPPVQILMTVENSKLSSARSISQQIGKRRKREQQPER
jgi:hypothetical protein